MNHICTWFCADAPGEESLFPQTGIKSSDVAHREIYWKCIVVFFIVSKRFNPEEKHVFFTNVDELPVVEGLSITGFFQDLDVEVVNTPFNMRFPKGYYNAFQNQFYLFSIFGDIIARNKNKQDRYLILDCDCVFTRSAKEAFEVAASSGFMSFSIPFAPDRSIHGLSRNEMKEVFEDLLGREINEVPEYFMGEFFLADVGNIEKLYRDFKELRPDLIRRHKEGLKKFNEEAQTLSFLYYKNGLKVCRENHFIKRIWTNPLFYRNVNPTDKDLMIWHMPAEKCFGFASLFDWLIFRVDNYSNDLSNEILLLHMQKHFGIPYLQPSKRMIYFVKSCHKGLKSWMRRINLCCSTLLSKKLINRIYNPGMIKSSNRQTI